MFLQFFGLREQPFGVTPDPRYLYLGGQHREVLASLYYGLEANRGFLAMVAKPGMGKTTLLFHLLEKFRNRAQTAFVFQTQCTSREFMRFLLAELGIEHEGQDLVRMHEDFNRCLLREAHAGRRVIVVIDEAQNLAPSVLETVRLLSDFETPRAKLLQIILSGQPELAEKLASPSLKQLHQRVASISGLNPLSEQETAAFIAHRLRVAGYQGSAGLFSAGAISRIAELSEGIPRNINNLCFHTLSLACALKKKIIDMAVVEEVARDLDIRRLLPDRTAGSNHHEPTPGFAFDEEQAIDISEAYLRRHDAAVSEAEESRQRAVRAGQRRQADPAIAPTPDEARAYVQNVIRMLKNSPARGGSDF
jgi:general secretion pathway protein A